MKSPTIISDPERAPVVAQEREDGGLLLHAPGRLIALSRDETARLIAYVRDDDRVVTTTPAKARLIAYRDGKATHA